MPEPREHGDHLHIRYGDQAGTSYHDRGQPVPQAHWDLIIEMERQAYEARLTVRWARLVKAWLRGHRI
jgi:hypothetical protein